MQGFQQTTQLLADMDKELSKVKGLQSHVPLNVKGESERRSAGRLSREPARQGAGSDGAPEQEPRTRRRHE